MDRNLNISVSANNSNENVKVNTSQISVEANCESAATDIAASIGDTMYEKEKFLYEKAIEGRNFHQQCFNHWMNMYAIFNGALLMSFVYLKSYSSDSKFLHFMILMLGCVVGFFWHFSVRGFYNWILSWIGVVAYHEEAYLGSSAYGKHYVYRLFVAEEKDKTKSIQPFSTQKLTKYFTLVVAISWMILAVWQFLHCVNWFYKLENTISFLKFGAYMLLCVATAMFIIFCAINFCKESDLRSSHCSVNVPPKPRYNADSNDKQCDNNSDS